MIGLSLLLSSIVFENRVMIPASPELRLHIENKTNRDFALYDGDGNKITNITANDSIKTKDVSNIWENLSHFPGVKGMHLSIGTPMNKGLLHIFPALTSHFTCIRLRGNTSDYADQKFDPAQGQPSFLISILLNGEALENSKLDLTTSQQ